jgi:DNA-binding NarL/FixJ family response regulator
MIRVLLVDDHELVREGLSRLFAETPDIRVKESAGSVAGAMRLIGRSRFPFDIAIVDVSLPDGNGLDLIRPLRARPGGGLPVLVLSIHSDAQYAIRALRKGASGYVTKDSPFGTLADAVRQVASGGRFLDGDLGERMAAEVAGESPGSSKPRLSDREFEVLRRIASGRRSKDIAAELSLSVKTVATFKARICRKTGLCGTAEIVRYAIDLGLVGGKSGER